MVNPRTRPPAPPANRWGCASGSTISGWQSGPGGAGAGGYVPTRQLLEYAFRDGTLKTSGTDFDSILPPMSRFSGMRETKKQRVVDLLTAFFEKYAGVVRTAD